MAARHGELKRALRPEVRLEVLPAVVDAFDQNGVVRHHEGDSRAPFESNRSQARQQVVASRTAKRERVQALAERDDATDIGVSRVFARSEIYWWRLSS